MKKYWVGGIAVFVVVCVVVVAAGLRYYKRAPTIGAIISVVQERMQNGVRVFRLAAPMPDQVVSPDGIVVIASGDIEAGRDVWRAVQGEMGGSVLGQGRSAGPDWTADWLHREALFMLNEWSRGDFGVPYDSASARQQSVLTSRLQAVMRKNTYDGLWNTITVDPVRGRAIAANILHYRSLLTRGQRDFSAADITISDPVKLRQLGAFFFWTSWTASTHRPSDDLTYTSNWPREALVGNSPSRDTLVWSVVSVVILLAGIGGLARIYAKAKREARTEASPGREPAVGSTRMALRDPLPLTFLLSSAALVLVAAAASSRSHSCPS